MSSERKVADRRIRRLAAGFRQKLTAVRVPWFHRIHYWCSYIGLARRGVLVHSPFRDAQYADGFWKRRYDNACERINRHLVRRTKRDLEHEIPRFAPGELSVAEVQCLMRCNIPFLLERGAADLPFANWTLDYLESVAGDCPVPINGATDRPSKDLSRPTKAHHYYDFHTGTVSEAVASIRNGGTLRISEAEDVMYHANGRLRADLNLPYFEELSGWVEHQRHWLRSRLFVGKIVAAQMLVQAENAFSLWHAEPGDNFFVMAKGRKTWTFAHPRYTAAMRPRVKNTTNYHGSNLDIREPDDVIEKRGFDGYGAIPLARVVVEPGDILRVPDHWWHTVVTHPGSEVISVSIRSNSAPTISGLGYGVLRLADRKFQELARALATTGRIHDIHIGYPRPSRGPRSDSD